jgi:hypothetical protein
MCGSLGILRLGCDEAEHHGREHVDEQSGSPRGKQEADGEGRRTADKIQSPRGHPRNLLPSNRSHLLSFHYFPITPIQ